MKSLFPIIAIFAASVANAAPYVSGKIGVSDFVVDTEQYLYHSPDAYKSTVVDGRIDDINAIFRGAVGYNFGTFRIDAEYTYGQYTMSGNWALNTTNGVPGSLPPNLSYPATYTLRNHINMIMANVYYDIFQFGMRYTNAIYTNINYIRPSTYNSLYIMAGAGMAHIKERGTVVVDTTMAWGGDALHEVADNSVNRFAYAVGLGLNFGLGPHTSMDLSYRYGRLGRFDVGTTTRDYSMHDIALGVRYEF